MNNSLTKFESLWGEIPQNLLIDILNQFINDLSKIGILAEELDVQGLSLEKVSELNLEKLFQFVHLFIQKLLEVRNEQFWQLIYVIDIPEELLKALPEIDQNERAILITKMVLVREWQKIELRKRFSPE